MPQLLAQNIFPEANHNVLLIRIALILRAPHWFLSCQVNVMVSTLILPLINHWLTDHKTACDTLHQQQNDEENITIYNCAIALIGL